MDVSSKGYDFFKSSMSEESSIKIVINVANGIDGGILSINETGTIPGTKASLLLPELAEFPICVHIHIFLKILLRNSSDNLEM